MSDALLTYAVSTDPDPLQVSPQSGDVSCDPPPGDASCATLTILVSNSSESEDIINCQSIDFGFSVGKNASDFSEDLTGVAVTSPPGWNFLPDGNDFTATPKTATDGAIGKDGLTFTLSKMKVNKEPGTASLLITETASSLTADPPQPQDDRTGSIDLAKFPLEFKVSDLMFAPDPPLDFGGSVTLSWVGTEGATYELRYEGCSPDPITQTQDGQPLPANGSYRIDNLEKDTTFYLFVTLVVEGEDHPPKLERDCPVIVTRPQPEITFFQGVLKWEDGVEKLYLHWEATNANVCNLMGDSNNLGAKDDNYPPRISPADGSTYTLTAGRFDSDAVDTSEITYHSPLVIAKSNNGPLVNSEGTIAVSRDGAHLYVTGINQSGSSSEVRILDASTFEIIARNVIQQNGSTGSITLDTWPEGYERFFAAQGPLLYVVGADTLDIGEPIDKGLTAGIAGLVFSPDGSRLYLISTDGTNNNNTLSVISGINAMDHIGALQLDYIPGGVAVSPDGQRIYVTNRDNATVNVYDGQSLGLVQHQGQVGTQPSRVCISPDGAHLYVLNSAEVEAESKIFVLDAQTLQLVKLIHLGPIEGNHTEWGINANFAISPDGTRLYVVNGFMQDEIGVVSPDSMTGGKPRAS